MLNVIGTASACAGVCFLAFVARFYPAMAQDAGVGVRPPALFMFGASTMDSGNNNLLQTQMRSNFPPYGMDFIGRRPTGRFSNGKIPGDLIASRLGVKQLLPPYVGARLGLMDILTGVSFASGGAGYDPLTSQLAGVISMQTQLNLFREYKATLTRVAGEERAAATVSGAVYTIAAGTDDIANTYFSTPVRSAQFKVSSYVDIVSNQTAAFLEGLIGEGARKIAVMSLPPVGCLPSQRTRGGGLFRQCDRACNHAAMMYNNKTVQLLPELEKRHPGTRFQFLDIYRIMSDMIENPSQHGLLEVTRGCCGTGEIEVALTCNQVTPVTCPDDTKFLFWDSFHPTEKAYEIIVDSVMKQYDLLAH